MPRSVKAGPKAPTTQRRAAKRSTSKQPKSYEIPESPPSDNDLRLEDQPTQSVETASDTGSAASPAPSSRARSLSSSSDTLQDDPDPTPRPMKHSRKRLTSIEPRRVASVEPQTFSIPGFEALEAVNGLYQKLKDSQAELDRLRQENERLVTQERQCDARIASLEGELKTEKEKLKKTQDLQIRDNGASKKEAEDRLYGVVTSLQSFAEAASGIMPLLDVLTGAADIEYNDATERLYQVLRRFGDERVTSNVKHEPRS